MRKVELSFSKNIVNWKTENVLGIELKQVFFFQTILFTRRSLTLLTALITLTLYLLLTLLILILTLIMHTLHYDTCITILLTLI